MRYRVLLGLTLLALSPGLKAVRLESTRLAPEASVWFEPNHGQVGGRTEWTARAAGAWLFLTSNEVVYALPPEVHFDPKKTRGVPNLKTTNVHMRLLGARRAKATGENPLGGYSNYFLGKHENEWFTGVPHFGQVRYADVYPGIDVVYYATGRNIEYDFIVKPGADPSAIELSFDGNVQLDESGNLVIAVGKKSFRQHRPRVFQGATEIEAAYRITEQGTVKVDLGDFDPLLSLRVDPILDFSTYLGGPGEDHISGLTIAPDGNVLLAGGTQSPASPTLDPFQQPSVVGASPIVLKMSPDGRRVIFYTILGRTAWDFAYGVAVGQDGAILIGGSTRSANFPLKNAFQTEFRAIWDNGFVAKLTSDARSLVYSSYIGGSNTDHIYSMTVDRRGDGWFVGSTQSNDFPLRKPLSPKYAGGQDGVIVKISPDGGMLFSSYYGGSGVEWLNRILEMPDGSILMGGVTTNAEFPLKNPIQTTPSRKEGWYVSTLVRISPDASEVLYSTLLGGTATSSIGGLGLDRRGNIWISGTVGDRGLPLKDAFQSEYLDGVRSSYLMKLDPTGQILLYSSYISGIAAISLVVDNADNVYVGGLASAEFPVKDSLQPFKGGGVVNGDLAVMKFAPDGRTLTYATILGGSGNELGTYLASAGNGIIYGLGDSLSPDFPTKNAYQPLAGGSFDAVFFRLTDNSTPLTPAFLVTPVQLTFRYVQGESAPTAQTVALSTPVAGLAASAGEPWLRVTPTLSVSVNPAGLVPGVYRGTVRLTPQSGLAATVAVTLNVLAAAPLLTAVEPERVAVGSDDTEITLRGAGFSGGTKIQIDGNPWALSAIRLVNSSTLRFTLLKSFFEGEYNHSITVQNPDSAVSKPVSLAVGRPAPSIAAKGIVSAASYAGDVISPGEILTLFGENFEPGMRVNFDGLLATPLYITPGQLSVVAPTGLTGAREVNVIVEMNFDWRSIPVRIPVWPARPGLFTANSSGKGQAAALNQDGSVNSPANPAVKGSIAVLYGTGGGVENLPSKVFIDGIECEVLYAGQAPGLIAGAWQLNVRIPEFASKGEVVWRAGERESVEGVFVALKEN